MSDTPWPHFTYAELACKCCGEMDMDDGFMRKIETLRRIYDQPFIVTSAYRCPAHNSAVSSTGETGPHTTGHAIDLHVAGEDAFYLMTMAINSGAFTGVGVKQKGPHESRFIHLDDIRDLEAPRPRVWSY